MHRDDEGDDLALRSARRDRVLDAAAGAGVDVAVLGRRDSVAYATGAGGLWTAGTRTFGPADDLLRTVRAVKLPGEVARIAAAVGVARTVMKIRPAPLAFPRTSPPWCWATPNGSSRPSALPTLGSIRCDGSTGEQLR